MKRWAVLVIAMYGLILAVLAGPVMLLAFLPDDTGIELMRMQVTFDLDLWPLWAAIGVMMLAEAALLVVPVRVAAGRRVGKRHVFWTALAAAFALGLMITGLVLIGWELLERLPGTEGPLPVLLLGSVGALWLFWSVLFSFYPGRGKPRTLMSRVVRFLVAGSILELLVAVPSHIIARWRNLCCGGYLTVWGLATGIAVLLFAFGPGAFILFVRRLHSVRPPTGHA